MNKLSKILIAIIVILVVALGIATYNYFSLRKYSDDNLEKMQYMYTEIKDLHKELGEYKSKYEVLVNGEQE